MKNGSYVEDSFERDTRYIPDRITAAGTPQGHMVQAGRYRLVVARACPWAHRAVVSRRLLGLEDALSMGICGPVHDADSWAFDLDPDGKDPVLHIPKLKDAYEARPQGYRPGVTVPAIVEISTGQVVTNDFQQMTRDFATQWSGLHRQGAPDLYPQDRRDEIEEVASLVYEDVNNGVYRCGFAGTQDAYDTAYTRLFERLDWLTERLRTQRYLVGNQISEADIALWTTLVRFDAVYHGHFKCNRQKLEQMPVLHAYARDLFQTPGFGDTVDFDQIKAHYYATHLDINPTGVIPRGPLSQGWLAAHDRAELGGSPFGEGTAPPPPPPGERVPDLPRSSDSD
ncbi:MAG: glutathione S-transferase C-terminal domain-containing protein [Ornithinimicrobium sp.]